MFSKITRVFANDPFASDVCTKCHIAAARLGRRSRKMRDMISEATRTIEDSQTAQALHGLLSLKQPDSSVVDTDPNPLHSLPQFSNDNALAEALQKAQGNDFKRIVLPSLKRVILSTYNEKMVLCNLYVLIRFFLV